MKWNEKSKIVHLSIDQDKARKLGVSSAPLATTLQTQLSGLSIAKFREDDKTVDIVFRFDPQNRNNPQYVKDINI
ncbi:efflux RND transporter permease subunit, partial [Klebsiella pneumoniae]|nr:efflux RND transporter permease subunit [Klebsiella pneumoniae]